MAQDAVGQPVKDRLLRDMDRGFEQLMSAVRAQPAPRSAGPGAWGRFEVLSHLAGWHAFSARRLGQIARGEEPMSPSSEDEMNAAFVGERRGLTAEELIAELDSSYHELRAAVIDVPAHEFWLGGPGKENSLAHFVASANSVEHYEEHAADLHPGESHG